MEDKLKNYKVGIIFGHYYQNERKLYCSCGHVTTVMARAAKVCEKCGNTHVIQTLADEGIEVSADLLEDTDETEPEVA